MSVEIIGRAVCAPGAGSTEQLFDLLKQRRCTVTEVPGDRWDKARYWHPAAGVRGKTYTFAAGIVDDCFSFDPTAFGMSAREGQLLDPQQRMILQLTSRAIEDANLDIADLRTQRVGVYVGASSLDHGNLIVEDPAAAGPYFMTGNTLSIVSNRISHVFGLNGPSLTVDTACSSSLVALDVACKALEAGEVDTAIVGGVNALTHPLAFVGFAQARMLSPDGLCRAYDEEGAGYVRAEGGGVVVLRRTDSAKSDRSHASILASGVNSAGRTNGISLPSREAQAALLRSIYGEGGIDAQRLAFIEGHGTGTKVGDPAELWSIGTVVGAVRRAPIPIGSIKTNIGHTEPASGILGLVKAMLALENNLLPASLHFDRPVEAVDFKALNVHVASEPIELLHGKQPRLAGVNSFGFGGTNAHVVISDPLVHAPKAEPAQPGLFIASAHTQSALATLLASYRTRLRELPQPGRSALVAASGANRQHLRHRFVTSAKNPASVDREIEQFLTDGQTVNAAVAQATQDQGPIAFVFSGNGSQWAGMGVRAYQNNAAFRDRFNVVHALFQVRASMDLVGLLLDPDLAPKLQQTTIAQPLLFAIQATIADVLAADGIRPTAVFGHSVGEVAAAYTAGAISLVDAVSIVALRSLHQESLAGRGKMIAVQLRAADVEAMFRKHALEGLCIAAMNSSTSVTVSGTEDDVVALREHLRKIRIPAQILDINYPFHHPLIETAREPFLADMSQIALRPTQIPFISTVTGDVLSGTGLDADYWWSNVRQPVRFKQATEAALAMGCTLFVEIGPRPILLSYVRDTIKQLSSAASVASTFQKDETADDPMALSVAKIVAHGGAFDRRRVCGPRRAATALPSLPFEPVDLRHEFTTESIDLYGRFGRPYTLAGWRVDPASGSWKNHIDARLFPDLAEHVVDGTAILPGSAFLDMAFSAAREFYGTDRIEVANLELLRPLPLSDTHLLEVSTLLSPDTGDLRIRSRERLSADEWTLHAVCRCKSLDVDLTAKVELPVAVPAPLGNAASAYDTARRFGLDYGPAFQLLERVRRHGDSHLVVDILTPAQARHPSLSYGLHPIAVDAAFHGLVALFDHLSGDDGGAPYIPVRFGEVRIAVPGVPVRAAIAIRRLSPSSIVVDIDLHATDGSLIATLSACRFKRTFLRTPRFLADVSYHQSSVVLGHVGEPAERTGIPLRRHVFAPVKPGQADGSTQMLQAAVYRSCYDVALRLADGDRKIDLNALPGDVDFQRFVSTCLGTLEQVGLGATGDGGWTVEAGCDLPAVPVILKAVAAERPDRIAEVVAINAIHAGTMARLSASTPAGARLPDSGSTLRTTAVLSDATMDHLRTHSSPALARGERVREALKAALEAMPVRPLRVVELCSHSRALTLDLAGIAADFGASFVVVETREAVAAELSAMLESWPGVEVVARDAIGRLGDVAAIVSASDALGRLLDDERQLGSALAGMLSPGGRVLLAMPAPGLLPDYIFGLTPRWFSRTRSLEFPLGILPAVEDYESLLRVAGLADQRVQQHELCDGSVIVAEARAVRHRTAEAGPTPHPFVFVASASAKGTAPAHAVLGDVVAFGGDPLADRATLSAALSASAPSTAVIYAAQVEPIDAVDWLTAATTELGLIADVMAMVAETRSERAALLVVVPGGAPARSPRGEEARPEASALWAFLRVLRNEFDAIDVHAVDAGMEDAMGWAAVRSGLSAYPAEREWFVDAQSGTVMGLRVVPGPLPRADQSAVPFTAARLRQAVASQIARLTWEQASEPEPAPDEVVIKVEATGLNFRDVMWAMGMLPEEALEDGFAGPTIGMECSGSVASVGRNIMDLQVGDAVMAVAPAAFATHVKVRRHGVARTPSTVDLPAAATLPVAFITAYYALVELAHLKAGETLLIHGGAGGVGLAALQIAKARGARVLATAGSGEKRELLTMLGVDSVFNSRSLNFADDVLAATDGQGVDVVLNSLFGEAMERSLALVRPFGRFLELGKRDFYADSKIGLRPFRRNVSYFGIDADQLLGALPDLGARLLSDIAAMFENGVLTPLPYRAFRHDEIADAFRLMQSSGHVGKIVVSPPVAGRHAIDVAPASRPGVDPSGVHVVVGGVGGFGLAAAGWLVARGARRLALVTRRGVADTETQACIDAWKRGGIETRIHACDVTDETALGALLADLREVAPIRSIIHAAMVLDDAQILNLTPERVRRVLEPKVKGADILDRLTRQDALEAFLLFSSATTLVGNPGQANYVTANGFLEGLARQRRRLGLPGLAVAFGAISDVGVLSRQTKTGDLLAKRIGKGAMTASQALGYVSDYLARDPGTPDAAVVVVADIDWAAASQLPTVRTSLFETVARSARQSVGSDGDVLDLAALVAGKSPGDGEELIFQIVAAEIAAILRVAQSEITRTRVVRDVGLDSLMATELGMSFHQKTGFDMPLGSITQSTTVGDIARKLYLKVAQRGEQAEEETAVTDAVGVVDDLASRHRTDLADAASW